MGLVLVILAWVMLLVLPRVFAEVSLLLLWIAVPVIFGIGMFMFAWGFVVELR